MLRRSPPAASWEPGAAARAPPLPTEASGSQPNEAPQAAAASSPLRRAGGTGPQKPPPQGLGAQGSACPSGQLDTCPQVAEDKAGGAEVLFRGLLRSAPAPWSLAGKGVFIRDPHGAHPALPSAQPGPEGSPQDPRGLRALTCVQGAPLTDEAEGTGLHSPHTPGDATRRSGTWDGSSSAAGAGRSGQGEGKKLTATPNKLYRRNLQTRPGPTWQRGPSRPQGLLSGFARPSAPTPFPLTRSAAHISPQNLT